MSQDIGRKPVDYYPKYEPIAETFGRVVSQAESRTGEPEIKTGLEIIDQGFYGLHKQQLVSLCARPGNGKSSLACQIAFNIADSGKEVAFVSLEMSRESIISKMFCNVNKVDSFEFFNKRLTAEMKYKADSFDKVIEELPLRIIDDYCYTQDEIFTLFDHLEYRPEVIILDHLNQIRTTHSRSTEREMLSDYLKYLKEIAMKHKIAILCLCQINREGDEMPTIKTIKGTGSVDEISDQILLLHLVGQSNQTIDYVNSGPKDAIINLAKSRYGFTGCRQITFDGRYGKFYNFGENIS
jgi:replicative DNA helicase